MCPVVLWCGQAMELHCKASLGRSGQFVVWHGFRVYRKAEQAGESGREGQIMTMPCRVVQSMT